MLVPVFSHLSWVFLLVTVFIDFLLSSYYCFIDIVILWTQNFCLLYVLQRTSLGLPEGPYLGLEFRGTRPSEIHTPRAKASDSTQSFTFS